MTTIGNEQKRANRLTLAEWEKLLARWSQVPLWPETKLICAVIALGIVDELDDSQKSGRAPFSRRSESRPLQTYCEAIGIEWQFVIDAVDRCGEVDIREMRQQIKAANALRS